MKQSRLTTEHLKSINANLLSHKITYEDAVSLIEDLFVTSESIGGEPEYADYFESTISIDFVSYVTLSILVKDDLSIDFNWPAISVHRGIDVILITDSSDWIEDVANTSQIDAFLKIEDGHENKLTREEEKAILHLCKKYVHIKSITEKRLNP